MKGGFFNMGSLTDTSSWSNWFNKTKDSASSSMGSLFGSTSSAPAPASAPAPTYSSTPTTMPYTNTGGRKRTRKHRRKRGGGTVTANTSRTSLAYNASPVSGINTVKPNTMVGGRRRRRTRKYHTRRRK